MQHARPNRLRSAVAYAALAALLGVVSFTLSQCTMVGDNVTGVRQFHSTTCGHACAHQKNIDLQNELKDFKEAQDLCKTGPLADREQCLNDASAQHEANVAAIQAAYDACQAACHRQGTGSAG